MFFYYLFFFYFFLVVYSRDIVDAQNDVRTNTVRRVCVRRAQIKNEISKSTAVTEEGVYICVTIIYVLISQSANGMVSVAIIIILFLFYFFSGNFEFFVIAGGMQLWLPFWCF